MDRRFLTSSALIIALLFLTAGSAVAQSLRPERTFFLTPRVGITNYIGDNDTTPLDFDDWSGDEGPPWLAGLEAGYQVTTRFSVSGLYALGNYPTILSPADADDYDVVRHTGAVLLRWTAMAGTARVAPYIEVGFNGTTHGQELTIGPSAGIGLDVALNDRMSFIVGLLSHVTTPDEGVDYVASEDFTNNIDLLNWLNLGLKYNFKRAVTPVEITALECPARGVAGEAVTFTAAVNEATMPIEYTWNFGDGATGTGLVATHTFDEPGSYTVIFTAENPGGTVTRTCIVNVDAAPVPPEIVSISADPMTFQVCDPVEVEFDANVRGDEPLTYRWDFGDGETAMGEEAEHVYDEPGTYNVRLTVSNEYGTVNRSLTVTAQPCTVGVCYEITEMNAVFFPRNSSELTAEARAALMENLEIFRECPNLCARLVGYAAPGERNPQALSEARAAAVADFYADNGIAASRFTVEGRGVPAGVTTSKKEGAAQYRRVDTLPVQCDDLR